LKGVVSFGGFEVADVLADEDMPVESKGDTVFQMSANGDGGRDG